MRPALHRTLYAELAGARMIFDLCSIRARSFLLTASRSRYDLNSSFAKPGPAMTRHLTMLKSTCRVTAAGSQRARLEAAITSHGRKAHIKFV